ncbi:hypothetical protein QFC19_000381 [Naganishia cerealis]|uniref:Uncharacterized protein n=1 Tax=Naganishia cerealis TaxID=610337 RepID=A0ACC2WQV2_9TREE|nr:hypothetical protein QFC19_000381 [Naganishia cerealis]
MVKEVVIIGGSFAGLKAAKHILAKGDSEISVTVVSKSTHAFYTVAAPRLLLEPSKLDKAVAKVEETLKKNNKNSHVKFIHGSVESLNLKDRSIDVNSNGQTQLLTYDVLVIASGTRYATPTFKLLGDYSLTIESIEKVNKELKAATKIAVIGGGPTGVETAGEIGYEYGKTKTITLYTGSKGPLSYLGDHRSKQAELKLQKLGVKVANSVRPHVKEGKVLTFEDGTSEEYDVVIEANGLQPNSDFLPADVLDESGFVLTNDYLQLKDFPEVVAGGDIVSGTASDLVTFNYVQWGTLLKTLDYLFDKSQDRRKPMKPIKTTQFVPISREGGIGILFGCGVPNFLVRMLKAKDFMLSKAQENF